MKRILLPIAGAALLLVILVERLGAGVTFVEYTGACDASAVVPLNEKLFVVADDEDNILRVYAREFGGPPLHTIDLSQFLGLGAKRGETDVEDAARIGDIVYWISSHGRNAKGKLQPSRHRFFATTATVSNQVVDVHPVGRPYTNLLYDMLRDRRLNRFNLSAAARLAPKSKGALNIEGLCATPQGHLLIGFRNPIPDRQALLIPLLNPAGLIAGQVAKFGDPILLDLGGRGVRSMTLHRGRYLIIAGSFDGKDASRLYEWRGGADQPRWIQNVQVAALNPEAIASFSGENADRLLVLSDDGAVQIECVECKKLKDFRQKRFRATNLTLTLE